MVWQPHARQITHDRVARLCRHYAFCRMNDPRESHGLPPCQVWSGIISRAKSSRNPSSDGGAAAGREVEADHFGISLAVARDGVPAELAASIRRRRPDIDPAVLVATSWPDARRLIDAYVAAGLSKFVIRPAAAPPSLEGFLDDFAREMMPLQT